MQISPVDRSVAIVAKADGTGASASGTGQNQAGKATNTATGTSEPVRAGITQDAKKSSDYLSAAQGAKGPDSPSADASNQDWAITAKALAEKQEKEKEEIKPPLFELLIEQFNSLWRASAKAIDATTQTQALTEATRQSQQDATNKSSPLVYTDPSKVRKTSSAEGA